MDKRVVAVFLVLVAIAGGAFLWWRAQQTAPAAPVATPTQAPVEEPAILHPVPSQTGDTPLPGLGESDTLARKTLSDLFGAEVFARFFVPKDLVRKFVATVDSLPRATTSTRVRPVQPVDGAFQAQDSRISPKNAARYEVWVQALESVDAKALAAAYFRAYPLCQEAYEELGFPGKHFNDRLVVAIDDLLAAPEVDDPQLVQRSVMWEYADPALESRSSGQKILMRMGPANAARVKTQLRRIRDEITKKP